MTFQGRPEHPQLPGNAWPSPVDPRARGARPEVSGDLARLPKAFGVSGEYEGARGK